MQFITDSTVTCQRADTAHNDNRGVHLAFSTCNSKVVDSNVTSFIALNSNFGGKWNTLYLALLSFMTHIQINVVSTEVTMADMGQSQLLVKEHLSVVE